jgi:hypothetical protein
MKKIMNHLQQTAGLTVFLFLFSCAAGVSQKSTGKNGFQDDLSVYRPKFKKDTIAQASVAVKDEMPVSPSKDVTSTLNQKLDQIASTAPKTVKGFRVMIYSGNSKEEATTIKEKASGLTSENVYIEFKAPNFRVKVGDAANRLEANYLLGKLKKEFPTAVIVPDEINVN